MTDKRVTSLDVAEAAGVSQSTVSRALSGAPSIGIATRTRVEEIARQLGYHVDRRAAQLRKGETGTIAIVVVGRAGEDPLAVSQFHYALLGSTCAAAAQRGLRSLVSFQSEPDDFFWHYRAEGQADALIAMGTSLNRPAWLNLARARDVGSLVTWGAPFPELVWVRADNAAGGEMATRHLIARGRRRIAFVGAVDELHPQFRERLMAYRSTVAEAGLAPIEVLDATGEDRLAQGRIAAKTLLEGSARPDAIFAASDAIAIGVLEGLAQGGARVPEDVAVVGFDGLGSGVHTSPALTTIEPDFARAGQMLVSQALGDSGAGTRVPVNLVVRDSCG
ncbi:LacI family transcriptional regulator [Erythrobacter sp. LQ02-29]|uniref:LacI family DNA-binding transcriptional regulator n=1 Tax=Erythrobacter sp. LQ02-29 TaxID=2920384 RepID=UPI001F4E20AA|nr:LacI family transcriptional regulator [Erythrobacter sp. LQ02-29]